MARIVSRLGLSRYDADEHYKLALAAYKKQNLEEALVNIGQAIELHPRHAEYHAAQGFFYLQDGVKDKAQTAFETAIQHNRYEMMANYGRGILAYQDKNWAEAEAHFSDAWAAMPDRPETQYYLGLVSHRKGDQVQGLAWMKQAEASFEKVGDRGRVRDAGRWIRELTKLIASGG